MANAIAGIDTEVFVEYGNNRDNGILIGILTVREDASDLSSTGDAQFRFVSKFGELLAGAGGISTTTLQQAYDNSSDPEITINSTLDGLSIKNGTGNADNVTSLIQGQNTAGTTTSFIRADGAFSGTSIYGTGLTATTVSATTYQNLPVSAVTSGTGISASTSNGTVTITNTSPDRTVTITGGTNIQIAGSYPNFGVNFTGSTGSSFTGGTVTGPTNFTNGLTANTISATTYYNLPAQSGLTIGTTSITGGSSGQVLFHGSGNVVQETNSLTFDSASTTGQLRFVSGGLVYSPSGAASWSSVSAGFEVQSTTKGFLQPRMTSAQRDAISSPATGLTVYQTTDNYLSLFNGTNWQNIVSPNSSGNVLIGTTTDAGFKLEVNGTTRINSLLTSYGGIVNRGEFKNSANIGSNSGLVAIDQFGTGSAARIYMQDGAGAGYPVLIDAGGFSYFNAGNFAIGKLSDSGQKLQVSGNTLITGTLTATTISATTYQNLPSFSGGTVTGLTINGNLTVTGNTSLQALTATTISASTISAPFTSGSVIFQGSTGSLSQNNSNLFWDNTNGRLGININTPAQALEAWGTAYVSGRVGLGSAYPVAGTHLLVSGQITGAVIGYGIRQAGYVQNDVTLNAIGFHNRLNKTGGSTLPTYYNYLASGGGSISGTVTNQMGYAVGSDLTNATNNYAFHSELTASTGVWNLYMNGSALNYLNGSLLIGTNTDAGYKLDVNGTARIGDSVNGWQFSTNNITIVGNGFLGVDVAGNKHFSITDKFSFSTFYFRVAPTTGNILIGTSTDTGQKLQVSGNTLIQGGLSATTISATTKTIIGSENSISCALLQMASTTQGVLFPRMTNAQRTSIVSPQPSLMVYCTDFPEGLFMYKSTGWVQII
jgi:hypothetical protein